MHVESVVSERVTGNADLDARHEAMRAADAAWRTARANGAPYADVLPLCRAYVRASEAYQRAKYGRVQVRRSAEAILR